MASSDSITVFAADRFCALPLRRLYDYTRHGYFLIYVHVIK